MNYILTAIGFAGLISILADLTAWQTFGVYIFVYLIVVSVFDEINSNK